MSDWLVLAGPASKDLSFSLSKSLDLDLIEVESRSFPDGERKVRLQHDVKNKNIILVQSLHPPIDGHLMQLLFTIHKLTEEGAKVLACVPYLAYARQDLEFQKGEVISLSVLSRLFRSVGVSSLVTVDIHSSQGLGYFSFPTYSVSAMPLLANYAKNNLKLVSPLAVSPDFGGSARVEAFAKIMDIPSISLKKSRNRNTGEVIMEKSNIEVTGRDILLIDDMITTGNSIVKAANYLKKFNTGKIYALCSHAVLIDAASSIIQEAGVEEIIATNTIPCNVSKVDITPILTEHFKTIR